MFSLMDLKNVDIIICTMIFVAVVIYYVSLLDESYMLLIYFRWLHYMLELHGEREREHDDSYDVLDCCCS